MSKLRWSTVRWGLLEAIVPILLVALWWWQSADSHDVFFPPLKDSWTEFKHVYIWDRFEPDVLYSVRNFIVGFAVGCTVGFCSGIVLGLSNRTRRNVAPLTEFFRATPIVAIIPIGLSMVGPGMQLEAGLIALGVNWPVMLNTADGIRGVDPGMIETARSYGLSREQRIRKIMIPAAMPQVLSGVRISVGLGVAVMVVANMFANDHGLGARVVFAQANFDIKGSWAGIIMIAFVGIVITVIYTVIHNRLLRWHRGWRASAGAN